MHEFDGPTGRVVVGDVLAKTLDKHPDYSRVERESDDKKKGGK